MEKLTPELHRKIFNLLPIWNIMLIHKVCHEFRNYKYYNQVIPLVLYDNIFSLEYALEYIALNNIKSLYRAIKQDDLTKEYLYCLIEQISVLLGDYTIWDCWYYTLNADLSNVKYHETKLYTRFYKLSHHEYSTYYKNNRFIKGLL